MFRAIILLFIFPLQSLAYPVGVIDREYHDVARDRALRLYIWYPSSSHSPATVFDNNPSFHGFTAIKDAPFAPGRFPLILLSHGSGGNRASLAWLATQLAEQGAVVIALNHAGSTTGHSIPSENIKAWQRPRDVSFVLDQVLKTSEFARMIDTGRIAVIGHSLGGYTALATIGVTLRLDAFRQYCVDFPLHADCEFNRLGGIKPASVEKRLFEGNYSDARIAAVVAITPAYARSFDEQQLGRLNKPVLIIGATDDQEIPNELHARYLSSHIPHQGVYAEIKGAGHFGFLPLCRANALAILKREGEEKICLDPVHKDRRQVHRETFVLIQDFLQRLGFLKTKQ